MKRLEVEGMKILRRVFCSFVVLACANLFLVIRLLPERLLSWRSVVVWGVLFALLTAALLWMVCRPQRKTLPTKRIQTLSDGYELLLYFLVSVTPTTVLQLVYTCVTFQNLFSGKVESVIQTLMFWMLEILIAVVYESVVFWSGMIRLYVASVQLGLKHRVLGAVCGWILGLNIYYLVKMLRIVKTEMEQETEKFYLNEARAEQSFCKTRYPLLLVHGVFFRDSRYLNYWGRISSELQKNGTTIFYGNQQSAASVEDSGKELAERIVQIVQQTGCEKVNIIAHSKGGLDCRAAISHFGAAPYVASLTTINTPHRGCLFADYLLNKIPQKTRETTALFYNTALKRLGDSSPDFLSAVSDLTAASCEARNETTPDAEGVLYQSVMSYCKKARSGKFPLNVSYPLVKHFDGKNDGLVAVQSAQWGERFVLVEPKTSRGISHADMIDLNRENIPGFDVREFYVSLVSDLKEKGY